MDDGYGLMDGWQNTATKNIYYFFLICKKKKFTPCERRGEGEKKLVSWLVSLDLRTTHRAAAPAVNAGLNPWLY
jgi:hypothetical protein